MHKRFPKAAALMVALVAITAAGSAGAMSLAPFISIADAPTTGGGGGGGHPVIDWLLPYGGSAQPNYVQMH